MPQLYSLKAICYRNKGNQIRAKQDFSLYEPMLENFTLAKQHYLEAADCLAEDDESHAGKSCLLHICVLFSDCPSLRIPTL